MPNSNKTAEQTDAPPELFTWTVQFLFVCLCIEKRIKHDKKEKQERTKII